MNKVVSEQMPKGFLALVWKVVLLLYHFLDHVCEISFYRFDILGFFVKIQRVVSLTEVVERNVTGCGLGPHECSQHIYIFSFVGSVFHLLHLVEFLIFHESICQFPIFVLSGELAAGIHDQIEDRSVGSLTGEVEAVLILVILVLEDEQLNVLFNLLHRYRVEILEQSFPIFVFLITFTQ